LDVVLFVFVFVFLIVFSYSLAIALITLFSFVSSLKFVVREIFLRIEYSLGLDMLCSLGMEILREWSRGVGCVFPGTPKMLWEYIARTSVIF
jgi:hypothetical protein